MIVLFTDFGLQGPYTGQMKAVLHQMAPGMLAIDLFADAPVGNPKASAYLLAAYAEWFAAGTVFLCVVDPGVGGTRPSLILEADRRWYVGPGNGLFELVQRRAGTTRSWDIDWKPERLSASLCRSRLVTSASPSKSARFLASTTPANIGCSNPRYAFGPSPRMPKLASTDSGHEQNLTGGHVCSVPLQSAARFLQRNR